MDPLTIIAGMKLANEGVKLAMDLYENYKKGKIALSTTDAAELHQQLIAAQATTARLEDIANAALDAAITRGD